MNIKAGLFRRLDLLARNSTWYRDRMFPDCEKFWGHNLFNLDVVNLGSTSGVHAFDYSGLNIKGANWALGHNPLMADKAILGNYYSYLRPRHATVIFSLCAFSSLSGSYSYLEDRYYSILHPNSIPGFSMARKRDVLAVKNNPLAYYPFLDLLTDVRSKIRSKLRIKSKHPVIKVDMEASANNWINGWMREFNLDGFEKPLSLVNSDGVMDAAHHLNEMFVFCREYGFKAVMVVPPMFHTLASKFTPQARDVLFGVMLNKIADKEVPFLNYMDDPEFTRSPELFRDAYFLNSTGAKIFTRRVLKDLHLIDG